MKHISLYLAAVASIAAPAFAAPITYTVAGRFTGTIGGNAFDTAATFTGIGDTASAATANGITLVDLTSFTALAGGTTYVISTPFRFGVEPGLALAGFARANDASFADAFYFAAPAFAGYSGTTSLPATAATPVYTNASFTTNYGDVNLTGASDLSFAASAAAVPESGTWAMLVIGFGAIGGALRHRRRVTVRYAA